MVGMEQKLRIHYYFNDQSHAMNAFVRNKAEKDLLEAIKRVGEILDQELILETEAYQEGGLVENIILVMGAIGGILHYLSPSINDIVKYYFTRNIELEDLQKEKLKAEISKLGYENNIKELELKILTDKQVSRHVSNFYKKIDSYEKIQSIGFKDIGKNSKEYLVDRSDFKNFILIDNVTITDDEDAMIEIISPVLKEGKFNWRGRYLKEKIDFSMGDYKFKIDVIEGKYTFSNGSAFQCWLQITTTYDDFGDEKRKSYSVRKIYGIKDSELSPLVLRKSGVAKKRQEWLTEHDYGSLLELDKNN